jgi:hypothetical protein
MFLLLSRYGFMTWEKPNTKASQVIGVPQYVLDYGMLDSLIRSKGHISNVCSQRLSSGSTKASHTFLQT